MIGNIIHHYRRNLTSHLSSNSIFSIEVQYNIITRQEWAIIRSPCNLKFFFAGIPQGPLETSPGTIGIIQKRFQGPPARGF